MLNRKRSLTDEQVMTIPDLLLNGKTHEEIAKELGIVPSGLGLIFQRRTYPHIQEAFQTRLKEVREELKLRPEPETATCTKCGKNLPRTEKYFSPCWARKTGERKWLEGRCRECKSKQNKDRHFRFKTEVMQHYSATVPVCACCGDTTFEFLSIDHIDGGGAAHRREIRGKVSSLYLWLKNNNYPTGFRVLCMNCNTSLGFHGYCPHQKQAGRSGLGDLLN